MIEIPPVGAHGGDGPAIARALGTDVLDLSQSLNPFAPDVAAILRAHADAVGEYPDPRAATERLAATLGVDPGRVLVTNGGSEAIRLVADELGGTVASEPEFSLHPRGDGPVWRSDPHNPTGRLAAADAVVDVWDEAFYPLATGRWHGHRPGIAVGSLTKVFACPGLRLGYIVADDVDRFARRQLQWSVGAVALAVMADLLPLADLPRWRDRITEARQHLIDELARRNLHAEPTDAPWVLVTAPGLRDRLARHGVVVRDCASFGLLDQHRIAVPDEAGLARLVAALDASKGPR